MPPQVANAQPRVKRGPGRPPKLPPGPPTRCALYERVSDEEQVTKGVSLPAQDDYLRAWASMDNLEVMRVYKDEGKSGRDIEGRPGFREMVDDAKNKRWLFEVVLVSNQDRFARNVEDQVRYDRELREAKVEVRYGNIRGVDTRTPAGRLTFVTQAGVAEFYSGDLSIKVKMGMDKKGRMGYVVGGVSRTFFTAVEDPTRLRKNDKPSRRLVPTSALDEAVRLRSQGLSYAKIAARVGSNLYAVRRALLRLERITNGGVP